MRKKYKKRSGAFYYASFKLSDINIPDWKKKSALFKRERREYCRGYGSWGSFYRIKKEGLIDLVDVRCDGYARNPPIRIVNKNKYYLAKEFSYDNEL